MITYERWLGYFADQVGELRDEPGTVSLLHDSEVDDDVIYKWYLDGVKPKKAAERFMAGEGKPR